MDEGRGERGGRFDESHGDGGKTVHCCKFRKGRTKKISPSHKVKKQKEGQHCERSRLRPSLLLLRWRSSVEVKTETEDEELQTRSEERMMGKQER